jgi:hypothetical protein
MRRQDALVIAVLLLALSLSALFAPRLAGLLPREAMEPAPPPPRPAKAAAKPAADTGKKISVQLYFAREDVPALAPEEREVAYASDLSEQIRTVVEELIKGSSHGRLPALPPETRVHGVFISARGTAYVDLSKEAAAAGAGSLGERLSVYALVDSIVANFPAIRRVQILVDDRPAETLLGHVDLSHPLPADMTLVAVEAPPPVRSPEDAPAAPSTPTPPPPPAD